jgi:flavin-dependent dehydrogenase
MPTMSAPPYDVIVLGARCAGSPTAMLLARNGHRVLVLDRATFPSDTVSTHLIHPPGVEALDRWGLLDQVVATGCPPIEEYAFDFGPFTITGRPGTAAHPVSYAPRRTVLDKLLVDAAVAAGAEVREGFSVSEIVVDDGVVIGVRGRTRGGSLTTEHARVVIGADGFRSRLVRTTKPAEYHSKPQLLYGCYSYWSGLEMNGRFETYDRSGRAFAAWPTNDGLTLVICGWPYAERPDHSDDIEQAYLSLFAREPSFDARIRAATREERIVGASMPNVFRRPYGPGWALVGDAGYTKDFITAQGIADAFTDAELCAAAVDQALTGSRGYAEAMADYQARRDQRALPMYELTCEFATLQPPSPQLERLLVAVHGNPDAMERSPVRSPAPCPRPTSSPRRTSSGSSRRQRHVEVQD